MKKPLTPKQRKFLAIKMAQQGKTGGKTPAIQQRTFLDDSVVLQEGLGKIIKAHAYKQEKEQEYDDFVETLRPEKEKI